MTPLKLAVLGIALLIGAWMAFDGSRAFVVGDYVTPKSGPSAGQLGPWSRIVAALGLDPRSTVVKSAHLMLGVAWLGGLIVCCVRPALGWWILMGAAVGTLWYLPIGTVLSVLEVSLLLLPQLRNWK